MTTLESVIVSLPIRTLPIAEKWDCSGCGKCCRGNVVPLDDDDLQRLRAQNWDQHPDFRGTRTISRQGMLQPRYQLAQREDGTCVFLGDDGLCRIHKEFGFDEKPLICRMYPLQLVPIDNTAWLTLRRSCPTAAVDHGRDLAEYRDEARALVKARPRLADSISPPPLRNGLRRSWQDTLIVAGAIENLMTDERFPLVRRLVHGVLFCELLEKCRLKKLDTEQLRELVDILREGAPREAGDLFRERQPPRRAAGILFRQSVSEYLRLHPDYLVRSSWRERWKLIRSAIGFARGRGDVPQLHANFPAATFAALDDSELGHLDDDLQKPFIRYYETLCTAKQYAVVGRPGWSLIERFRALALTYPVALWMLRYFRGNDAANVQCAVDIVTSIDRGQGYQPLAARAHRRRVANLAQMGELERLIVWYAR